MKELLLLVELTMTSDEIADLVNSRHDNVKLSIERLAKRGVIQIPATQETKNFQGVRVKSYRVSKRDSYVVVAQLSPEFTGALVDRWMYLEQQLEIAKFRQGTKKHQLDAMEALSHLLPEDLSHEELSYIKANTVVNKATSNLFGFPKMLKKDEMSHDMLQIRERVLDDYIALYEIIEDNSKVKDILYDKYQPKRMETTNG